MDRSSGAGNALRKVLPKDREAMVSIIERTGNLTKDEKNCAIELLDIYLNQRNQTDYFFIGTTDSGDNITGYACYGRRPLTEGVFDLYWIVVDPDLNGRGLGRALIEGTARILKENKARMMIAETSGLDSYEGTREFYRKNGFTEEGRIREFYKPGDDMVFFVKRL